MYVAASVSAGVPPANHSDDGSHSQAQRSYQGEFNPSLQRLVVTESKRWTVSLREHTTCKGCPSGETFVFEVLDKQNEMRREFRITNLTAQIDEVHLFNEAKLVVIGRASRNTSTITIVDLATTKLHDTFVCLRPSISADRRFVAFVRFFPEHSGHKPSFHYMVYDVAGGAAENRVDGVAVSNEWDAGIPVYPVGMANRLSPNVLNDETLAHTMASDGFFWLDERTVAFVDRSMRLNRLIVSDLGEGTRHQRLIVTPIPTREVVDLSKCQHAEETDFETWSRSPELLIYVANIRNWNKVEGFMTLDFTPTNPCLRHESLDVHLESSPQ
jgi:hypothetical protein